MSGRMFGSGVKAVVLAAAALACFSAPAGAAVLHDQYNNFGPDSGIASSDPAGVNNSTMAADDFLVPAGQTWTIDSIDVRANDSPPPSFRVAFHAGGGATPGAVLRDNTGLSFTSGTVPKDRSIPLSPLVLQPGAYWVAVQGEQTNAWGWVERTSQTGSPGVWTTEQDGSPCENVFRPKGDCFPTTTPDQVFRLNGTAQPLATCAGRPATEIGTEGDDTITATAEADVIAALGGADRVKGLGGNDVICGGPGRDTLNGGAGRDRLLGEAGKDVLKGGKGKDVLKGGKGKDVLKGGKGKDVQTQ